MLDRQYKRKLCKRCKRRRFSKFFSRDCSKADGLRAYCKDCTRLDYKNYYENNKNEVLESKASYKENNKDWYIQYAAEYREINKEELQNKSREYYQENKEKMLIRSSTWGKNNPRKRALIDHRYRAHKLDQTGLVSDGIEEILWKNQKGLCYYCSESLIELEYHLEHKAPLSKGGLHADSNLCLSCPQCNFRKGCKTEKEFCSLGGV